MAFSSGLTLLWHVAEYFPFPEFYNELPMSVSRGRQIKRHTGRFRTRASPNFPSLDSYSVYSQKMAIEAIKLCYQFSEG